MNIALNINLSLPLFFFTFTFSGNTLWMCSLLVSWTTPRSSASSTDFVIKSICFKQFFEFFCSLGGGGMESFHCILYPCWMTDSTKESFVVLRHILILDLSLPDMNGRGPSCFESFTFGRCWSRGSLLTFGKSSSVLKKCIIWTNEKEKMRLLRVLEEHVSSDFKNMWAQFQKKNLTNFLWWLKKDTSGIRDLTFLIPQG